MPQLSAGQTASIILAPADSYTVSASATTTVKGIYGAPSTTTTLTANFQTFGPYSVPAKLDISCASGTATYSLIGSTFPANWVDETGTTLRTPAGGSVAVGGRVTEYQSAIPIASPLDTANNILLTVTVPANSMGPNGRLQIRMLWSFTNNANGKPIKVRFGGSAFAYNAGIASQSGANIVVDIINRGMTNVQIMTPTNVNGTLAHLTQPFGAGNVDTTQDQLLSFEIQKVVGTDVAILEAVFVEIVK